MYEIEFVSLSVSEEPIHSLGRTGCGDEDVIIVEQWQAGIDNIVPRLDALRFGVVMSMLFRVPRLHAQIIGLLDLGYLCRGTVVVECRVDPTEGFCAEDFLVEQSTVRLPELCMACWG